MSETEREFIDRMKASTLRPGPPTTRDITRFQRIENEKRWDRVFRKMVHQSPVDTP